MEKIKIVYGYDPFTLEYIGEVCVHLCPVTESEYLIPANAVEIKPNLYEEGFAQIWQNNTWVKIEDSRGKNIYSCLTGEAIRKVETLYDIIPEYCTLLVPTENQIWNNSTWIDKPEPTIKDLAIAEIFRLELEASKPRRIREAILGTDNGWMANQENLIEEQRNIIKENN